jgi:adenylate cyclase
MRRLVAPMLVIAITGFAMGAGYRHLWDDPSEASIANYLRSGVHGMLSPLAVGGAISISIRGPADG